MESVRWKALEKTCQNPFFETTKLKNKLTILALIIQNIDHTMLRLMGKNLYHTGFKAALFSKTAITLLAAMRAISVRVSGVALPT